MLISEETGMALSLEYHYKYLVIFPLEPNEKLEALKHYFGITYDDESITRDPADLIISKQLRMDITEYRSLFPHVATAIQLRLMVNNLREETSYNIFTSTPNTKIR